MKRHSPLPRSCSVAAWVFCALLLVLPAAASATVQFAGDQSLSREVQPTGLGTTMTFHTSFLVEGEGEQEAFFRVVPSPSNKAFLNGTPEQGWWTIVTLLHEDQEIFQESGNGTRVIHFPPIEGNTTYTLRLDVNVPPGALAEPGTIRLSYLIGVRGTTQADGSGATMDPSIPVTPQIRVSASATEAIQPPPAQIDRMPLVLGIAIGLGVVGIVGSVIYIRKQERR